MSQFVVVNLKTTKPWLNENGDPLIFESGEKASIHIRAINSFIIEKNAVEYSPPTNGKIDPSDKWQVRPFVAAPVDWKAREKQRFDTGEYKSVPWASTQSWTEWLNKGPQKEHFVHISSNGEGIAYTKDANDGQHDVQKATTPSRYFTKYAADVSRSTIEQWTAAWTLYRNESMFFLAETREDVHNVYANGPDSCMRGRSSRWFGDCRPPAPHPTEAYIAGDLAVAYIKRGSAITARTVVWPEKKVWVHLYGDDSGLLQQILVAKGYSAGSIEGAKLLKIPAQQWTKKPNTFITPYVDGRHQHLRDAGEFFTVSGSHPEATPCEGQRGWTEFLVPFISELSGTKYNPRATRPVQVVVGPKSTDLQTWAQDELPANAFLCRSSGLQVANTVQRIAVMGRDGDIQYIANLSDRDIKGRIDTCGMFHVPTIRSEMRNVIVGYNPNGTKIIERWSRRAVDVHAFTCESSGEITAKWLKSTLPFCYNVAAHCEHASAPNPKVKHQPARYKTLVNRHNAASMLRRMKLNEDGSYELIDGPFEN